MTALLYAVLMPVHGLLSALALAALAHPIVLLRKAEAAARARRVAAYATLLLAALNGIGWAMYPSYRQSVKPRLRLEEPLAALTFETKEHLAWMALVLAVAGTAVLQVRQDPRLARVVLALALGCGLVAAAIGVQVAAADWLSATN